MDVKGKDIVVAMSGGVDSSVAAALLKEAGANVIGVSMQVWDYRNNGGCGTRGSCCSPDDFTDARKVAGQYSIPYYVMDMEDRFKENVIDKFVNSYAAGETPNPCVECNNKVKFSELRKRSQIIGFPAVATGHYARVQKSDHAYHLLRGVDADKDQSYFLYGLKQEELSDTYFPVGGMCKTEVRKLAAAMGLSTAEKPESQDICFVSGSVQEFLKIRGIAKKEGNFVDSKGQILGRHDGIQNFTVGQRKGLRIGGTEDPLYVLNLEPQTGNVLVGKKQELENSGFSVCEINWINKDYADKKEFECIAQLRHRHNGSRVKIKIEGDKLQATFLEEWAVVSPGQAAVFYDLSNQEVLGGGKIISALRA